MGEEQLTPTAEELQAYQMVKGLIGGIIDLDRVKIKKRQTYCRVTLDDNSRRPLCWLYFGTRKKSLRLFFPDTRRGNMETIENLDDLLKFRDRFHATIQHYESN